LCSIVVKVKVDSECTLHISIVLAINLATIIKFGGDSTTFWQKQVRSFLAHPVFSYSAFKLQVYLINSVQFSLLV